MRCELPHSQSPLPCGTCGVQDLWDLNYRRGHDPTPPLYTRSVVPLQQKLGQPIEFIHAPVPGYEQYLRTTMNSSFTRLVAEKPVWRNNWGISPSGAVPHGPQRQGNGVQGARSFSIAFAHSPKELWL